MGCYVNPPGEPVKEWLEREGREVPTGEAKITSTELPVCLVQNPQFFAAGVGFDQRELEKFSDPSDHRPKRWFMVPVEKLKAVSRLTKYMERADAPRT